MDQEKKIVRRKRKKLFVTAMKIGLMLLTIAMSGISLNAADDVVKKPSVLVYTEGPKKIDIPLLRYLNKRYGFNVDYSGTVNQQYVPLTWEMVKNYNCIIMLKPEGGESHYGSSEEVAKVLAKFMDAGGGVMLAPDMIHWDIDEIFKNWCQSFGKQFGAWFLRRQDIHEKDKNKVAVGGYFFVRYLETENIKDHPVTKGVKRIWYPAYQDTYETSGQQLTQRDIFTFPIQPSKEWTVLLKGSDTSYSKAENCSFHQLKDPNMESEKCIDSAPSIFAVREYGKGRMAFFVMNAEYHLTAGMHHGKGGSTDELIGGYNLEVGFNGRNSDFLKLLVNSIQWLSEPSMKSGTLGGYQQDITKLDEPVAPPVGLIDWETNTHIVHGAGLSTAKIDTTDVPPLFKGIIGAQTSLSGGKGTVADYKNAAVKNGLDYVVFLEDFANLSSEKLEQLKKDCASLTDKKTFLIPGYHVRDNRGHHLFMFGVNNLPWPGKEFLTADGKMLDMSARKDNSGLPHCGFVCDQIIDKNALGYFDLPSSNITRMWNLKLYHSIGLFHYNNGKLVDGMKENFEGFLEVNNAGCNIQPYAISLMSSPEAVSEAIKKKEMLTFVRVPKLEDIVTGYGALKYSYLTNALVFISNGPKIVDWSCINRDCVLHAESYVTPNYRFNVNLHVTSDVGLKEIKIWDGMKPYMRILPNGAKEYKETFILNHNQQKNLILEVTDINGGLAISTEQFDRNHMNMHYWCSDRINGNLKHGPLYFFGSYGEDGINFVSKGQDSFNLFAAPMFVYVDSVWNFVSSAGKFHNDRLANRPLQDMVSEDVGVYTNKCSMYFPESEQLWSVWGTYGPLVDTKLYDFYQTYINFRNHYARADAYIPSLAGIPNQGDVVPGLNISEYRFKVDQTLEQIPVTSFQYGKYGNIAGNEMVVALCKSPKDLPVVFTLSNPNLYANRLKPILDAQDKPFKIEKGGYYAVFGSKNGAATNVGYNVSDVAFIAKAEYGGIALSADVKGKQVKAGDSLSIKVLGLTGMVPKINNATRYDLIADYLGLDGVPGYQLKLTRGTQLPVTVGFCDLQSKDGAVDFSIEKPKENLQVALPVRVLGMNDKWSAYCYDKTRKLARPIGVYQGTAYTRFDPDYESPIDAAIGHPVTANNNDVVIVLTVLGDGKYPTRKAGKYFYGGTYSLQVNNPTDKDLKVDLTNNMDLPDFPFKTKTVEIKAGQIVDVIQN